MLMPSIIVLKGMLGLGESIVCTYERDVDKAVKNFEVVFPYVMRNTIKKFITAKCSCAVG
jgi:hypothetical protein